MTIRANPIFCAVDTPDLDRASGLARGLAGHIGGIKLGLEFFSALGPDGYAVMARAGLPIFLDLKLHDIPNTVAGAMRSITRLAPVITTVHAAGGRAMLKAAREAAEEEAERQGATRPKVVAVTVLTSLAAQDLAETGTAGTIDDQVRRLARLALDCGLDGVVCAPHEITVLRHELGDRATLVVPGLRPEDAAKGDQARVMTPAEARALGADVLVIGRPITGASDPAAAARAIAESLSVPI